MATTFNADVTISGDAAAGTMKVDIVQTSIQPPITIPPAAGWEPPSWLRIDLQPVPLSTMTKPAYKTPYTDAAFKTKIIRVSGNPGEPIPNISGMIWPDDCRHHYSSDQAWNADMSLIYLDVPGIMINGSTYNSVFKATGRPSDSDVRWHSKDPALMNFAAGSKLGTWNPKTGAQAVIRDFGSTYSSMKFGPWEGSFSRDGDMVALSCVTGGVFTAFAYQISSNGKWRDIKSSELSTATCDNVRISPLGNYIVWGFNPDVVIVTDREGKKIITLVNNFVSHFDVIVDPSGDEVLVGRVNSDSVGQGKSGLISKYRLRDGARTALTTGGWCSHSSTRCQARGRWSVHSVLEEGVNYPPYNAEIIMCELNGPKVYRLGHHHSPKTIDYRAEVKPSHSPDGSKVIFASAWGATGTTPRPVGCYVIEFKA